MTADDVDDLPPTVERLLFLLELEQLDRDLFRARSPRHRPNGRLFGGQVAAQSLRAATLTVDPAHAPHSLHGYFLRPGLPDRPLILQVDRIRDGRSFTTRTVKAIQDGEAVFSLSASFHVDEPAGEFQTPLPADVPGPDDDGAADRRQSIGTSSSAFDVRQVRPPPADERGVFESTQRVWVRTRGALPDDRALHACVLTYASDMGAVLAARKALRIPWSGGMGASLDHALWFHRWIRPDGWVLFDLRPVSNAGSRGLVVGTMHDQSGVHGATMTQEALIREDRVT